MFLLEWRLEAGAGGAWEPTLTQAEEGSREGQAGQLGPYSLQYSRLINPDFGKGLMFTLLSSSLVLLGILRQD